MFEHLETLPPDPILGLLGAYQADTSPNKVDLGIGVYKDEQGATPILKAVRVAEKRRAQTEPSKTYTGPVGYPGYNQQMLNLVFGNDHQVLTDNRVRSVQTPGGCGGLRLAADLIKRARPDATVWVSSPTWGNHHQLINSAGLKMNEYPYFDQSTSSLLFDEMMDCLAKIGKGDLVLLHGCCHNPTGADLNREQWQQIADLAVKNGFTPFIDTAYQGFGEGIEADAWGLRNMAAKVPEMILVASCSKNFGLYRERTGLLAITAATPAEADATHTQIFNIARGMYTIPPAHGGAIVEIILGDTELRNLWETELAGMRNRINGLRSDFVEGLIAKGVERDFSFIQRQRGMFSFLGIS